MALNLDNPILAAYIKGSEEKREAQQQQFTNELKKQEGERAQQQLSAYIANLEAETKHRESQLDIHKQQLQMEKASNVLKAHQTIAEMMSSGAMKPKTQEQASSSPVDGIQFGDQTIDPRQFRSPKEMQALEAERARKLGAVQASTAGLVTTAQQSALSPFEKIKRQAEMDAETAKLAQQQANTLEQLHLKGRQELEQISKTIEGNKAIANIHGGYQKDVARINQMGGISDPDAWAGLILSRATGGDTKPLGSSKADLLQKHHLQAAGYQEFLAPGANKLKELKILDPLVEKMHGVLTKLPTTNVGAGKDRILAKVPTTDVENLRGILRGVSGNIAKILGGESGRLTEDDIKRATNLIVEPGITVKQANERLEFFLANYRTKALDVILGGQGPKQKLLNLKKYEFDPRDFNKEITYKGKKDKLFIQSNDGEWAYFDSKAGRYKGLDE